MKSFLTHTVLRSATSCCALTVLCAAFGCAAPPEPKAPTSEVKIATFSIPLVTPVEEGKETQEKKGVTISVVPDAFQVKEHTDKRCIPVHDESGNSSLGSLVTVKSSSGDPDLKIYELTIDKHYSVEPDVVSFRVTVTNHTNHVVKLEGVVPRLNINSKQVNLRAEEIQALHQAVLIPEDTMTFTLRGPEWDPTSESAVIDFKLVDVAVDSDAAGNITSREHFNWTYKAVVEKKTVEVEKKTEQLKLASAEARQMGCPVGAAQTDVASSDEGSGSGISIGSSGGNK